MKYKQWIFLLSGFIFLIFSNGRTATGIGPWIASAFILLYIRKEKHLKGYIITSLMIGIANQISFWGFSSRNPYNILFYLPFIMGFLLAIPYYLDAYVGKSYNGVIRTIIFPLSYTTLEFIYTNLSPLGSTGSLAYTQTGFTALIQLASITGIYGITFIITWFCAVISQCFENIDYNVIKKNMLVYALVFTIVIGFGEIRLLMPENKQTVQVSGFNVYDLRSEYVQNTWSSVNEDPQSFTNMCNDIFDKLINKTHKVAQSGSKIVVWSEIAPLMLYQQKQEYFEEISRIAKEEKIYIVCSPYILSEDLKGKDYNKLFIFNPKGEIILDHTKYGGAQFDNIVEGDKKLKEVNTQYGNISGIICWDADFPIITRQLGKLKTDILFSPAADWKEIVPIHSAPAFFRGIENGMSVMRQTVNGLSFVSDSKGRYLTKMNQYDSTDWVITAQIPIKGSFALYPFIGDSFSIIAIICLFCVIILHFKRSIVSNTFMQ